VPLTPAFSLCVDDCLATLSEFLRHQTLDQHGNEKNNIEYIPEFEKSFRHPRNWGAWLGVYAFAGIALLPASVAIRSGQNGRLAGRLAKAPAAARRSTSITVSLKKRRRARSHH
jgi:lauroyl-KDO2-lipid IV(A) myristoyltransferase